MKKEKKGKVWIAGAGPGDAGLLTVRTAHLMRQADVIVYDALISAEILSLIPPDTRTIYVGKRSDHHLVPQEEINQILVREAELWQFRPMREFLLPTGTIRPPFMSSRDIPEREA